MNSTCENWHYTHNAAFTRNSHLQVASNDVYLDMGHDYDIEIANLDSRLRTHKSDLMTELMRRALEQNPDLARELEAVQRGEAVVREVRMRDEIEAYHRWKKKIDDERKAQRHIRYDDARNINALTGLRRSATYQGLPRQGKIEMEIDKYYNKYGIEPPPELLKELAKLRHAKELYLKRVKRDANGRIIRTRMAG